ncbi:hypothetical protein DL771_004858 [Monosporascus sp. 5C6A]|nr:hypothetical protein DL771_004858 [Monosporascus sp. 5C6A]
MAEVVGIVAGISGLVDLVSNTIQLVRATTTKSLLEITKGLDTQFLVLRDILIRVEKGWKSKPLTSEQVRNLEGVTKDLREEIASLNILLFQANKLHRKRDLLIRAKLALTGFEREVKSKIERIERLKSLLTLKEVADGMINTAADLRSSRLIQIQEVLKPCAADFIPSKVAGTCQWIWSHPKVTKWVDQSSVALVDRALCIYGVKGCGKSVLALSMASELSRRGEESIFFSFWAQREGQRKLVHLLSTFVWHLLKKLPTEAFHDAAREVINSLPLTEQGLQEVIAKITPYIKSILYVVIDGVDESAEEWSLAESSSLKVMTRMMESFTNIRLLLLGREAALRESLKLFPGLEISPGLLKDDISLFIQACLERTPNILTSSLRDHVQTVLEEKATWKEAAPDSVNTVKQFLESTQFCKWMEYTFLLFHHHNNLPDFYMDLPELIAWFNDIGQHGESFLEVLTRSTTSELRRRQAIYGSSDRRTETWQSIQNLKYLFEWIPGIGRSPPNEPIGSEDWTIRTTHSLDSVDHSAGGTSQHQDKLTTVASNSHPQSRPPRRSRSFSALSAKFSAAQYTALILRSPALISSFKFHFDPGEVLFNMLVGASHRLPPLIVAGLADYYEEELGKHDQAKKLCSIAISRTANMNDLDAAAALLTMGFINRADDRDGSTDCYRQAMVIMEGLPRTFLRDQFFAITARNLAEELFDTNQKDEGILIARQMVDNICAPVRSREGGRRAWDTYISRSKSFKSEEMYLLNRMVSAVDSAGYSQEALAFSEQVLQYMEPVLGQQNMLILEMQQRRMRIKGRIGMVGR